VQVNKFIIYFSRQISLNIPGNCKLAGYLCLLNYITYVFVSLSLCAPLPQFKNSLQMQRITCITLKF